MDYAEGGDLMGKINDHNKNKTHFSEDILWKMFIQMVNGIKSLHDLKICHRDLKVLFLENFL
jgi:NIMA (never in mitosis gene a)-related kinase